MENIPLIVWAVAVFISLRRLHLLGHVWRFTMEKGANRYYTCSLCGKRSVS